MVAIAKALSLDSRVFILDEPSDVLTGRELDCLFDTIRLIRDKGVAIVYISHRLEEIFEIGDRVTVLRDGKLVAVRPVSEIDRQEVITLMVGRKMDEHRQMRREDPSRPVVLEVRNLSAGDAVKDVSFYLRQGEVLGISGLVGAGRTELARGIVGADAIDSGEIILDGAAKRIPDPAAAAALGIGLVPEERKRDGLVLTQSVAVNAVLTILSRVTRFGMVNARKVADTVDGFVKKFAIKISSQRQMVRNLSGGNQQKVVLTKWFASGAKILILDEPTRGIDVNAKAEIYKIIESYIESGRSIILISSEMPEILNLCHRILVLSEGRITKRFDSNDVTQEEILTYAMPQSLKATEVAANG